MKTSGYREFFDAITAIPRGVADIAKNTFGGIGSTGKTASGLGGGAVGYVNEIGNSAASMSAKIIKASQSLATSRLGAPFAALTIIGGSLLGANHLVKKHEMKQLLAAIQKNNTMLEGALLARQQMAQAQQASFAPAPASETVTTTITQDNKPVLGQYTQQLAEERAAPPVSKFTPPPAPAASAVDRLSTGTNAPSTGLSA